MFLLIQKIPDPTTKCNNNARNKRKYASIITFYYTVIYYTVIYYTVIYYTVI